MQLRCHQYRRLSCEELPNVAQSCEFPVIVCSERKLIISGLCSALRYVVQAAQQHVFSSADCDLADRVKNLLGLRQNCLRACAEVSEWTLYAEVTLPLLVERIFNNCDVVGSAAPAELMLLENELAKLPVEPSRRRNQKQHSSKQPADTSESAASNAVIQECESGDRIELHQVREGESSVNLSDISKNMMKRFDTLHVVDSAEEICGRRFVEGNNVQLTDLVLFACVQLLFNTSNIDQWCSQLPRILSWYQRMAVIPNVSNAVSSMGLCEYRSVANDDATGSVIRNSHPGSFTAINSDTSLKSAEDQNNFSCTSVGCNSAPNSAHTNTTAGHRNCVQHSEKTRFRVSQGLVDTGVAKATKAGLLQAVLPLGNGRCLQLPWEQYPSWALPCGVGGVPDERATRKLEQLENIAAVVKELVSARSAGSEPRVIVDFCSGAGHVGILLAYLFPRDKVCTV